MRGVCEKRRHSSIFGNPIFKKESLVGTSGITLIALVVTIIVLMILVGISINLIIGENGIYIRAKEAQEEQAKAEELERLLMVIPEVAIKNNGKVDMDSYLEELEKKGIIDSNDTGTNPDGSKEIITDNGYNAIVRDKGNGEIEVIIDGKTDDLAPRISKIETKTTTNSIEITVEAKNTEGAKYSYYYKENGSDEEYKKVEESSNNTSIIEGVTQGKKYDVKVELKNSKGAATEEVTVTIGSLPEGTITFGEVNWNSSTHKAAVSVNTTASAYTLQYATSSSGPWTDIASGGRTTEQVLNTTIYARLTDGINETAYASTTITEKVAPSVMVNIADITKNSMQAVVTATDDESGIEEYQYYIKKEAEISYPSDPNYKGIDSSYTFTELEEGTSYNIKVVVQDFAKNQTIKTMIAATEEKKPIDDWEYNTTTTAGKITLTKYIGTNPEVVVPNTFEVDGRTYNTEMGASGYDSTEQVNKGPFINNTLITKVNFEDNVTFQNNNMSKAFQSCSNLTEVNKIPETVTNIDSAFSSCTSFNSKLVIKNTITSMDYAFSNCESLTQAPDMSNATEITKLIGTFYNCTSLEVAPDLRNCSNLKKIGDEYFEIPGGVSRGYVNGSAGTFPNTGAFYNCFSLKVTPCLPEGVENMSFAFYDCNSLKSITNLPSSVTSMVGTFFSCEKLESIPEFPANVTNINGTYAYCTGYKNIPTRIPSKVTNMNSCFYRDSSFSSSKIQVGNAPSIIIDCTPTKYDYFIRPCINDNGKDVAITLNYTSKCSNIDAIVAKLQEQVNDTWDWLFAKGSLVN